MKVNVWLALVSGLLVWLLEMAGAGVSYLPSGLPVDLALSIVLLGGLFGGTLLSVIPALIWWVSVPYEMPFVLPLLAACTTAALYRLLRSRQPGCRYNVFVALSAGLFVYELLFSLVIGQDIFKIILDVMAVAFVSLALFSQLKKTHLVNGNLQLTVSLKKTSVKKGGALLYVAEDQR